MKKAWMILLMTALLTVIFCFGSALAEEAAEDPAEWTVLFYLCGSDLESRYGYATGNLEEIAKVGYPDSMLKMLLEQEGIPVDESLLEEPGKVNVLAETGGSKEWHAQSLGMNIDPSALQRWSYHCYSMYNSGWKVNGQGDGFVLMQTLPLQSMADPETLTDFIRWGVETYPAKKYALVLWDHGDGARTGLFIDELFNQDIMYLYELKQALADGGAYFETVIIDACLMANIETAWNIREHAKWLVASEEVVPGKGTAIGEWLQQLMYYPECDGEWLGRLVCDTTSIKYANEASEQDKSILTWSVIDLEKIEPLIQLSGEFYQQIEQALRYYPTMTNIYMSILQETTVYGDSSQQMRDFGSLLYNDDLAHFIGHDQRNAALQALNDAVVYCVRGPGRSEARGLTFCYPLGFSNAELDIYAQNFPMSHYLAFLDAMSDWTAPDWVYEDMERLPETGEIEALQVLVRKGLWVDGMPGIIIDTYDMENVENVYYTLYRLNGETGETVRLGRTNCMLDILEDEEGTINVIGRAADPMHWPAIDGELLCMDLIQVRYNMKLYNVPLMIDTKESILRLGRNVNYAVNEEDKINEYTAYGIWEGYEENTALMNRSVLALSTLAGREYQLLYPVDGKTGRSGATLYERSVPLTMYRALDIEEIPVPAGTYFLEYEVDDLFARKTIFDRVEIQWDGQRMTFPAIDQWADGVEKTLTQIRNEK